MNHVNGLCKGGGFPCYAYKLANGRLRERYLANTNLTNDAKGGVCKLAIGNQVAVEREGDYADPFYPRFWEERLTEPYTYGRNFSDSGYKRQAHKGIFACDMGELFGDWIPQEWQEKIFEVIKACSQHRFYLLTKQPQNLPQFSPFPDNTWVGVTATDTYMAVKGLQCLDRIEAKVKFISFEPLLSQTCMTVSSLVGIDWVIIGAQTGPYKPPEISWLKEIVEAANKAGIKVFLKDNLRPLLIPEDCSKPNYLTEDIFWASEKAQLRQGMPEILYCSTCRVRRR